MNTVDELVAISAANLMNATYKALGLECQEPPVTLESSLRYNLQLVLERQTNLLGSDIAKIISHYVPEIVEQVHLCASDSVNL